MKAATFVGRGAELTRLEDVVETGRRAVVFVGGEAGIGKTRLVTELGSRARDRGVEVLVGGCLDLGQGGVPYAPVVDALRDLTRRLTGSVAQDVLGPDAGHLGLALGDEGGPIDSLEGGTATLQAVQRVLERLARRQPVLLVVEDVHWADRSTRDLVAYLAATSPPPPIAMVVTYRSDGLSANHPLRGFIAELERRPGVDHLVLERLGRADAAALLTAVLGHSPDAATTELLYQRSEGNPFFLVELAGAASTSGELPALLSNLLSARVGQLSADAQLALRVAAVGGRRIEHDRLAAVVPLDAARLADALREARDANIVTADPVSGRYEFRHALLHETVYADVLPGERRLYHARFAEHLVSGRETGPAATAGLERWAELAHHWRAAGRTDEALAAAVEAGVAAEAGYALPEAHQYYEAALELWDLAGGPPAPSPVAGRRAEVAALRLDRIELLARAADAASRAGAFERAVELTGFAIAEIDPSTDATSAGLVHERRAWFLSRAGRPQEAIDHYRQAVDLVPIEPPSAERARVLAAYADALERRGDVVAAHRHAAEAVAIAAAVGATFDEGHARHVLGLVLGAEGDPEGSIDELHRARLLAERNGDVADVAGTYVHLWRVLSEQGRADEVVRLAVDAAELARAAQLDVAARLLDSMAAGFLQQLGRWDEAEARLAVDERDLWGLPAVVHAVVLGLLEVDLGRLAAAREHLETARSLCVQIHDGRINGLLHRGLAELALWEGHPEDALVAAQTGRGLTGDDEMLARLCTLGLRAVADAADDARATTGRADGGATATAAELAAVLAGLDERAQARRAPATSEVRAAVATGQAERARVDGRPDPALWEEAAGRWEGLGFVGPAAYCRWRLAGAVLAEGRRGESIPLWQRAHQTAVALGAASLVAAIEDDASRAALPLAAEEAGSGDGIVPFGLTARELEVLGLVAAGYTNRQIGEALFISEKTASVHVSRILAKLDARTRAQAAAVAATLGLATAAGATPASTGDTAAGATPASAGDTAAGEDAE